MTFDRQCVEGWQFANKPFRLAQDVPGLGCPTKRITNFDDTEKFAQPLFLRIMWDAEKI